MTNPINPNSQTAFDLLKAKFQSPKQEIQKTEKFWKSFPIQQLYACFNNEMVSNIASGSLSGMCAVGGIQPFIYFNTMQVLNDQAKKAGKQPMPINKNPAAWYKGGGGFALSFIPATTLQTVGTHYLSKVMPFWLGALCAGGFSAIAITPAELIMTQQQKTQASYRKTAALIYNQTGLLSFYRGFEYICLREMMFTGAYMAVAPMIKKTLVEKETNPISAQMVAGIIAGMGATFLSQRCATAKTIVQGDLFKRFAFIDLMRQKGSLPALLWRMLFVSIATTLIPPVQEKIQHRIEQLEK